MLLSDTATDGTPLKDLPPSTEKRVLRECDNCHRQDEIPYSAYLKRKRAETLCRGCAAKLTGMAKKGKFVPSNKGKPGARGAESPSWRGGRRLDAHGYVMVHNGGPKTACGWSNYIKEHVFVMETSLGRKLDRHDVIHHINGRKTDNRLENLWLTNYGGHKDAHQSLQEVGYALVEAGLVMFDPTTGEYKAHVKLRELLEHPEAGNQQPSTDSNVGEGSTTRREPYRESGGNNSPTSAEHTYGCDDIV